MGVAAKEFQQQLENWSRIMSSRSDRKKSAMARGIHFHTWVPMEGNYPSESQPDGERPPKGVALYACQAMDIAT
jgi:hypothetical protein